jgi:aldose 1-epimerase
VRLVTLAPPQPETVTLAAGDLAATFAPALGMVGTSLRHAGEELLDLQQGLGAYVATGAVLGLPLLHPWANRLGGDRYAVDERAVELPRRSPLVRREEHGLPIHGLLAASPHWSVESRGPARLRAAFDFAARPELLALFPFPHVLRLDVRLTPGALTVATTLRATGHVAVPVSFGFHPYLRLPGVPRTAWEVTLPARRALAADGRGIPTGIVRPRPATRFALADRAFDDGFDGIAPGAAMAIAGGGRRIGLRLVRGYPAAQVFSPPGAAFVCLEPMTAPTDALRSGTGLRHVAPGATFTAVFAIEVDG